MHWILLLVAVFASVYIDSFRLLLLSFLALLLRAFPLTTISSLIGLLMWCIKLIR